MKTCETLCVVLCECRIYLIMMKHKNVDSLSLLINFKYKKYDSKNNEKTLCTSKLVTPVAGPS